MALLRQEKRELELMLSRVCALALWELGVTNGITDEQAAEAFEALWNWLEPLESTLGEAGLVNQRPPKK